MSKELKERLWEKYEQEKLEKLWKKYNALPEDLKEAIFSEETANQIDKIAKRNGLEKALTQKLAEKIGHLLLGITPPKKLEESLIIELNITKEKAKNIFFEINKFIISPFKKSLEIIYAKDFKVENPRTNTKEKSNSIREDKYKEKIE